MALLIDSLRCPVNYCGMDIDDNLPLRQNDPLAQLLRQDLDPLSITELEARITALQSEIERSQAKIDTATSHRSVADSLFKKV
jgi:uncharacterized small protein (DUF1192 family)